MRATQFVSFMSSLCELPVLSLMFRAPFVTGYVFMFQSTWLLIAWILNQSATHFKKCN